MTPLPQGGGGAGASAGGGGAAGGGYGGPGQYQQGSSGGNGGVSVREYNRRISACARRRDLSGSLQALAELDASPSASRNLFTYNAIINAMVMCSQYNRADQLWDEMLAEGIEPTLVSYNTRLKSCFNGTDADVARAFALVEEMEVNGIAADRVTFNSLINSCVAAGRVGDARKVYEQMQRKRIAPDDFTFTTLSKSGQNIEMLDALLVHQLNHHTALQQERAAGATSNQHSRRFSGSSNVGGKHGTGGGSASAGGSSSSSGRRQDHQPTQICPVAYNAIADAYIRCGHPHRALDLLNRMRDPKSFAHGVALPKDCIPVAPDVQTFNVKLKALRESGASPKQAFEALGEMQSLGLETDHISLLTLADLFCRRGEMSLAEGVLRVATTADVRQVEFGAPDWAYLQDIGVNGGSGGSRHFRSDSMSGGKSSAGGGNYRRNSNQPRNAKANASLFNALIRGYSSLDPPNVDAAVNLYSEMRRFVDVYGFQFYAPDSVTYTMLVDAFARVGDAEGAERIISEMEAAGPSSTSVVAYNALLKANRGNGSAKAFAIFERIKARGLRPDIVTVNTLVDQLISTGEPNGMQLAEQLVEEMPQWGLSPDLQTYNTLLKGAARSKGPNSNPNAALNTAFHWLTELRKNNLQEDQWTWQSMVAAAAAAGNAPKALEFFRCVEAERARRHHVPGTGSGAGCGAEGMVVGGNRSSSMSSLAAAGSSTGLDSQTRSSSAGSLSSMTGQGAVPQDSGKDGSSLTQMSSRNSDPDGAVANGVHTGVGGGAKAGPPNHGANDSISRRNGPRSGNSGSGRAISSSASLSADLMNLGAQAGLTGSPAPVSNPGSRLEPGADVAGSMSSNNSTEGHISLAHPSAYISLMRAFLSSGRDDGIDATLRLRDEMVERNMLLGRSGYTVVADAYAMRGDVEKVEDTLREMSARDPVQTGPELSAVHHAIRVKCLCNAGRVDDALALLPQCTNADAAVYNTILFSVARNKDKHRMISVLRAMEAAGIEPDDITARALQPLMSQLARALRSFDNRFHHRLADFVTARADGSQANPGSVENDESHTAAQ